MNAILSLAMIAPALIWVWVVAGRNFPKGVALVIFLFLAMSDKLRADFPGAELTFHRAILLLLTVMWISQPRPEGEKTPLRGRFVMVLVAAIISALFSHYFSLGFKSVMSFLIEEFLFFVIVYSSLRTREDIARAGRYMAYAIALVGTLAIIEYYTGFNPVDRFVPGYSRLGTGFSGDSMESDIMATYNHRILLGYALVMGWPFALMMGAEATTKKARLFVAAMGLVIILGCYFAHSRGPWIGMAIAGVLMFLLGQGGVRKTLLYITAAVVVVMIVRPGVRETITGLMDSSFDDSTLKGASYQYRWECWGVATKLAKTSAVHFLFGHGGLSTQEMDVHEMFTVAGGGSAEKTGFTSWDNNYASIIVEYGFVGFFLFLLLMAGGLKGLFMAWKSAPRETRNLSAALLTTGLIYMYALTNVYVFAVQLHFFLWACVAMGLRLAQIEQTPAPAPDSSASEPEHAPEREDLMARETLSPEP